MKTTLLRYQTKEQLKPRF